MNQDWRALLKTIEERGDVVRIKETVAREYEISTLMMDLEKKKKYPVVVFENVAGSEKLVQDKKRNAERITQAQCGLTSRQM